MYITQNLIFKKAAFCEELKYPRRWSSYCNKNEKIPIQQTLVRGLNYFYKLERFSK